jgi:hypothetical protein
MKLGDLSIMDTWTGCREEFRQIITTTGRGSSALSHHCLEMTYIADEDFKKCPFNCVIKGEKAL